MSGGLGSSYCPVRSESRSLDRLVSGCRQLTANEGEIKDKVSTIWGFLSFFHNQKPTVEVVITGLTQISRLHPYAVFPVQYTETSYRQSAKPVVVLSLSCQMVNGTFCVWSFVYHLEIALGRHSPRSHNQWHYVSIQYRGGSTITIGEWPLLLVVPYIAAHMAVEAPYMHVVRCLTFRERNLNNRMPLLWCEVHLVYAW